MKIHGLLALTLPFLLCLSLSNATVGDAAKFHPKRAKFLVKFKDEVTPYEELSAFVLPSETLILETQLDSAQDVYEVKASAGLLIPTARHQWRWQAPREKGVYRIKIKNAMVDNSITLHAFVMVPFSQIQGEQLNGYRIGHYPSHPLKDNPAYTRPRGFIEVTRENEDTHVSPHFKLKQFLCKQPGGYPKYLVLRERLLLKLEAILEKVNESGYRCETFNVMSGYRTPYYNKAIGNTTTYSRHNWGDAADIFIDNDHDGLMDDLNHDDRIDKRDAAVLYDLIEKMQRSPGFKIFDGGLGMYDSTAAHGPFVHVDVRGYSARW
ncbi:MAG TPA: peptidase M15A [Acidobacteriota bacterium]|jgi:hypothetical protein